MAALVEVYKPGPSIEGQAGHPEDYSECAEGELIFSKRVESATEVQQIHRLYANHATCVVRVTYL